MRFSMLAATILTISSFQALAATPEMQITLKPDTAATAAKDLKDTTVETKESKESAVSALTPTATSETPENAAKPEIDCKSLTADLKAMREAQSFMLNSMVKKNNSLAETLDLFAKDFSGKKGHLKRTDFQKLKKSAEAFRGHADRERNLVSRFESSADELMDRVRKCLETSPIASQTGESHSQN